MDIPIRFGQPLYPISHILGFRPEHVAHREVRYFKAFREHPQVKKYENVLHTVIASWIGLALVGLSSKAAPSAARHAPAILGSFGAEAVLLYGAPTSPLAQPRNILFGNGISAIIGMGFAKIFANDAGSGFPMYSNDWAAGATSCCLSIFVTQIIGCPHPPGGATALLAATNSTVFALGWYYVGYVLIGSCIMLGWALFINNTGRRRYPQYWISPDLIHRPDDDDMRATLNKAPGSTQPEEHLG